MTDEVRVVDPETGGAKGSKPVQPHLAPTDALQELFTHYSEGESKYPSDESGQPNYARGYRWSLSYNAAMRHLLLFWLGETDDPETGSQHVIAAAWHCLALAHFRRQGKGTDDRWGGGKSDAEPSRASHRSVYTAPEWLAGPTTEQDAFSGPLWVFRHPGHCDGLGPCAPHAYRVGCCNNERGGLRCVLAES